MRQHYDELKRAYPDAVILFRTDAGYEVRYEDATDIAPILGLDLSVFVGSLGSEYDAVDFAGDTLNKHLRRLIDAGLRVVISD